MCKECFCEKIIPTTVWGSVIGDGAGACHIRWFLTEEEAEFHQDNLDEGWGEPCVEKIETYEGSNVHRDAIEGSVFLKKTIANGLY